MRLSNLLIRSHLDKEGRDMRRWWLVILSAIVAFLVLAGAVVVPFGNSVRLVAAQVQSQEPTNQLRELAEYLLAAPFPAFWFGQKLKVQLLPGQLPTVPPLNLPIPPKGQLVGSALYRVDNEIAFLDILLQTPEKADDVMSFYRRSLVSLGWQVRPSEPSKSPTPGFHSDETSPSISQIFCPNKPTQPWYNLSVGIVAPPTARPNVRVNLLTQAFKQKLGESFSSPCDKPPEPERPEESSTNKPFPSISAPVGVEFQSSSSFDIGTPYASMLTLAKTNKNTAELDASIAHQMEAVGWQRVTSHVEKPLAWSIWKIPAPGNWQGVLLTIQSPTENQYLISVLVTSQEKMSSP